MSRRKGIMLAHPLEERRLAKWTPPFLCQPKLDGVRCRALPTPKGYVLLSSEENIIFGVPHINEALEQIFRRYGEGSPELDGEIWDFGRTLEEIVSRVSRESSIHPDHESLWFHVFDIISEGSQIERLLNLQEISNSFRCPLSLVDTYQANSIKEVMNSFEYFISQDYEGIIVRHINAPYVRKRSPYMMKFKPKKHDSYLIVGTQEEVSKEGFPKGALGALILNDTMGGTFNVGSGFTREQREELWEARGTLEGKWCNISYQHRTAKGLPKCTVFISVSDTPIEGD